MLTLLIPYLPLLITAMASLAILLIVNWFLILRHPDLGNERKFPRQIAMLVLTLVCILAIVLVLPVGESSRNQLIGFLGLMVSGIIAFSSTNMIASLMAGILLRVTKPFRIGDFIRVGDHFGRVAERGLFDTEIQSENRELVAIPNTCLVSHPVTTIRTSGTIISITLSLGYDVHHSKVEALLITAAQKSGLNDSFVHILELGNYSITYRISGFLPEIKWMLTARSNLCKNVLDILHEQGVEIMSPAYMNQRRVEDTKKIIPAVVEDSWTEKTVVAEEIVFDKAERAEQVDQEKQELTDEIQGLETALKEASDDDKKRIQAEIERCRRRLMEFKENGEEAISDNHITEPSTPEEGMKPRV